MLGKVFAKKAPEKWVVGKRIGQAARKHLKGRRTLIDAFAHAALTCAIT